MVEQLNKPCFVLDSFGKIVEINDSGSALLQKQTLLRDRQAILRLVDLSADVVFKKQVGELARHAQFGGQTKFFRKAEEKSSLKAKDLSGASYQIQISTLPPSIARIPLPAGRGWPAVLVIVEPHSDIRSNVVERWASFHSLTPAETLLLNALVDGRSLRQASELLERTYNTVRSQLKSIFQKTNTNSQSQLIAFVHKGSQDMVRFPSD